MILFFFIPSLLFASSIPGFFKQFPNSYFVETGSLEGNGIAQAVEAGFHEIHSVELAPRYYDQCKERFAQNPNVHLWLGDSAYLLEKVIEKIDEPITFWLDGHWSDETTGRGETNTPILKELEAIQRHPIKTHTILIDDVRCFGSWEFDNLPLKVVLQKIYEINPKYRITYARGFKPNDILVAEVPKESQ